MSLATAHEAGAPLHGSERIAGLDALRGVALLGILLANVRQMFLPWDVANLPMPAQDGDLLAWWDWRLFHALVDLKFIALFSLLFGAGFALQGERLHARGANFGAIYLRRVLILALFGLAHGLLLYPAEVLLPYAVAGLLLLALRRLSVHQLFVAGFSLVGTSLVWAFQIGSLGRVSLLVTLASALLFVLTLSLLWQRSWRLALLAASLVLASAGGVLMLKFGTPSSASAAAEYAQARTLYAAMQLDDASAWPDALRIHRQGNFAAVLGANLAQYLQILFYFAILLLWRTLGLFLIGAALLRSEILTRLHSADWRRIGAIGLVLGLPLSALATALLEMEMRGAADWRWPYLLHQFAALPLAAGIAGLVLGFHRNGRLAGVWQRIEAAGRMALSNYIGQSLVMATLAEPWGLGLYARVDAPVLSAVAVLVYAALALASHRWLRSFRMGPLEWLWRCGTYGQWLDNRRR